MRGMRISGGLFDDVLDIVREWVPEKKYRKETEYRDDLAEFIRKKLKELEEGPDVLSSIIRPEKHTVKRESRRTYADIAIDEDIGIELKRDLKGKSEIDRLVGQVDGYEKDYRYIIIVLCGEVDNEAVDEVEKRFEKPIYPPGEPMVEIVTKT